MIDKLNKKFGYGEKVFFAKGSGDLTKLVMAHDSGYKLELYLNGATITSWTTPDHKELLFLSSKAEFVQGKAIRGGIPLIFPQFGGGKLPSHGFARSEAWEVVSSEVAKNGAINVTLRLQDNPKTKAIWPYAFTTDLKISLTEKLSTNFMVINTDSKPFSFTHAFHTYFAISHINNVHIEGLKGLTYIDFLKNRSEAIESADRYTVQVFTDRAYLNAPDTIRLIDKDTRRSIVITKRGLKDAVVWNPWIEKSRTMADLGADDYQHFICVETANINNSIELGVNCKFECLQELTYA